MNDSYEARSSEFGERYEDFEGDDIVSLVVATGEWLEKLIIDANVVDKVMRTLCAELSGPDIFQFHEDADWRELWTNHFNESDLLSSQLLLELNAYAFWGLRPDFSRYIPSAGQSERQIDIIERVVGLGRALLDAVPAGWGTRQEMDRTVQAAEARLCIDTGRDVAPPQLAALARLSLKSIKNMLAPSGGDGVIKLNPEGKVSGSEARRWLEARADFQSSIWHLATTENNDPREEESELKDVLFVPVAKDGSMFVPAACRNARGYTIGKKGAEEPINDYLTAVTRLAKMPTPYWRRPNAAGAWSIVAGVSWQRRTLSELGLVANAGQSDDNREEA